MNHKRILLVEDDPMDIELMLNALRMNKVVNDVLVVRDGEEALNYLYRRGHYHRRAPGSPIVILLDLKLPKLDGLQVLRHIKSDAQLRLIPVVMLTSSREEQDVLESYSLGVNAYIVKPINYQDFVETVQEIGLFWAVVNEPPPPIYIQ